jgi:predicted DNA-binding protein
MSRNEAFATKIPAEVKRALDEVCRKHGLRKSFVVESALREKIEDLLDTYDLKEAIPEGERFRPWKDVKSELRKKGRA